MVSIVQAVALVGSAALLAQTKSVTLVWVSFPISEAAIFALSIFFLRGIWKKQLKSDISISNPAAQIKHEEMANGTYA